MTDLVNHLSGGDVVDQNSLFQIRPTENGTDETNRTTTFKDTQTDRAQDRGLNTGTATEALHCD